MQVIRGSEVVVGDVVLRIAEWARVISISEISSARRLHLEGGATYTLGSGDFVNVRR